MHTHNNQIEWQIDGMTCSNCALNVKKYLSKNGVEQADVNFATGSARFQATAEQDLDALSDGLKKIGYTVVHQHGEEHNHHHSHSGIERKLIFCALFTLPLLLHMFLPFHLLHEPVIQLLLCLPVMYVGWMHFSKSAFYSLKAGIPNMDVLIAVGSGAAFLYSLYGTMNNLGEKFMFYETAATIITLVLLGNLLEQRSVKQTTGALEELAKLQQVKAKLLKVNLETGKEEIEEIAATDIMPGLRLQVNTGDQIPTDGIVLSGNATVNESMLSGESDAIEKNAGDNVTGGTILLSGNILMKASKAADETVLAHIMQLVKNAQADLPPIQKLADRISAWFVPAVLGIAALTFLITYFFLHKSFETAMLNSIAVLVISCPCAMGLATPTAVMAGLGRSAQMGILVKSATRFETFAKTKIWVFDKTGTLTTVENNLQEHITQLNAEAKSILATLESKSSHPIAKAVMKHLQQEKKTKLNNITEVKGSGMQAENTEGDIFRVGSAAFTKQASGNHLFITKNNTLIGSLPLTDSIQPGAKEAIAYCISKNIKPIILSGDSEEKCQRVGKELGITEIYAAKQPAEKLAIIKELKKRGTVAMVGDGINDAPALATADVSISPAAATQVAESTAHITLVSNNLERLIVARKLAEQTLLTIRQNLFWAFAYNVIAIPIAAVGFLSPMVGALSMAFSDVVVIGNAILLRFKKIR